MYGLPEKQLLFLLRAGCDTLTCTNEPVLVEYMYSYVPTQNVHSVQLPSLLQTMFCLDALLLLIRAGIN